MHAEALQGLHKYEQLFVVNGPKDTGAAPEHVSAEQ